MLVDKALGCCREDTVSRQTKHAGYLYFSTGYQTIGEDSVSCNNHLKTVLQHSIPNYLVDDGV